MLYERATLEWVVLDVDVRAIGAYERAIVMALEQAMATGVDNAEQHGHIFDWDARQKHGGHGQST